MDPNRIPQVLTAEHLMFAGGICSFLLTLYMVRTRVLREKYAAVWMAVASMLLVCGLFPGLLAAFAKFARLTQPAAVLFFSLAVIYLFSFSVSISLSRQHRRNIRLTQELAILEERLRALETQLQQTK